MSWVLLEHLLVQNEGKEGRTLNMNIFKFLSSQSGEGNGNPLQYSCLENPMDGGAWWASVHGVAKSRTQLSDFTFTFHFHASEKEMATHSSVLPWRIPGTGEPGGLQSMGSHRVGHDWSNLAVGYIYPLFFRFFSHKGHYRLLCRVTCAMGFPGGASGKEHLQVQETKRPGFNPWVGKIPWRRA